MAKSAYTTILDNVPDEKKGIARKLIKELRFMEKTLNDLRKIINEKGPIEHFEQGKQNFDRESPALKSYNTTLAKYSALHKQLTDLMKVSDEFAGNALVGFMNELD